MNKHEAMQHLNSIKAEVQTHGETQTLLIKPKLIALAGYINNAPEHQAIDKVSFMAFLDIPESIRHVETMINQLDH